MSRIDVQSTAGRWLDGPTFSRSRNPATPNVLGLAESLGVSLLPGLVEGLGGVVRGLPRRCALPV